MKKRLLLLFALFAVIATVMAKPVDPSTARKVATTYLQSVAGKSYNSLTDITDQTPFHEFYVFTLGRDKGFVLVSSDDCVMPILGYSENSTFLLEDMPPHIMEWLQMYETQIEFYRDRVGMMNYGGSPVVENIWQNLSDGLSPDNPLPTAVSPLLTTTWNQSPYYNNLCPQEFNGSRSVTGCAATACAQIMKKWNHPATGYSSHGYTHDNYGYLSANFGNTTYNWSNMPNALTSSSTTAQVNAVATLMYHVGVAIDMDYSPSGSGGATSSLGSIYTASVENALVSYFKYKPTCHTIYYDEFTDDEWNAILRAELDANRPVLYTGYDTSAGHAFVFDGYNNQGQFHVNWGWGGSFDGYYAVGQLSPGAGGTGGNATYTFNLYNYALIGIEPNTNWNTSTGTTISLSISNSNAGSVTGAGTYSFGDTISFGATANQGFRFYKWSDGSTFCNRSTFSTGGSLNLTAVVEPLTGDTLDYCFNTDYTAWGYGSDDVDSYWGIALPAATVANHDPLTKVLMFVEEAGTYDLTIYTGNTPTNQVYTHTYTLSQTGWNEMTLITPLSVTGTDDIWIFVHNYGIPYPMPISNGSGGDLGSLYSFDTPPTQDYYSLGPDYSFMIKAVFGQHGDNGGGTSGCTTVTIGDEETSLSSYYTPVNTYYNYSLSETIIDASELGGPMTINSLSYYYNYATNLSSKTNCTIYVQPTTKTAFLDASDIEQLSSNAVMVYSGSLNCTEGWNEFTFTTPFEYDGTSNLMIIVDDNSGNYNNSSYKFRTSSCSDIKTITWYSDSSNPDIANLSQFSGYTNYLTSRALMRVVGCPVCTPVELEIGDVESTTSENKVPFNTYYNYSLSESIIDADEIGGAMDISGISYKYAHTTATDSSNCHLRIWIKPTTKTTFASSSDIELVDGNATLVYEGTPFFSQGWNDITFTNPYSYDGSGNLVVIVNDNANGYDGSSYKFNTAATTGDKTLVWYSDSQCPDPSSSTYSGTKNTYSYRPVMKLQGCSYSDATCPAPIVTVDNFANRTVSFSWSSTADSVVIGLYDNDLQPVTGWFAPATGSVTNYYLPETDFPFGYGYVIVWSICGAYSVDNLSDYAYDYFAITCDAEEQCPVYFLLTDSYGDGWNGGALDIYDTVSGLIVGSMAAPDFGLQDSSVTHITTYNFCPGRVYSIVYRSGQYDNEVSFTILGPDSTVYGSFSNPSAGVLGYFTHACPTAADSCTVAFPFAEDFEGGIMPNCWTTDGPGTWSIGTGDNSAGTGAHTGTYNAKITHSSSGNATKLITPVIDMTGVANAELRFWHVQRPWSGDQDELTVYYRTSATGDWQTLATYTNEVSAWTEEVIPLTNLSSTFQVAFEMYDGYGYGVAIDDITIDLPPACAAVTALTASTVTNNSVTLDWSDIVNTGATYTVYELNATGATVVANNVNCSTYTVTNLTAHTSYTFGVKANCSADLASTMTTLAVTTLPDPIMCGNDEPLTIANADSVSNTTNYFPGYSYYNYSYSEVIIPVTRLLGLGEIKGMEFYVSSVGNGSSYFNNCEIYLMNTTATSLSDGFIQDASSLQLVYSGDLNHAETGWKLVTFDSSFVYDGVSNLLVAVRRNHGTYATSGSFGSYTADAQLARYVYRDASAYEIGSITGGTATANVPVYRMIGCAGNAPECMPVSNLAVASVNAHDVTLSWVDNNNTGATYTVYNMTDSSLVATGITGTSYVVTGLSSETAYTFAVEANCSATTASMFITVSTTTPPSCFPVTDIVVSNLTNTSATLSWNGNANSYRVVVTDGTNSVYNNVVTDTTVALAGLTFETSYSVSIYAICGVDDTSAVATTSLYTGYCLPNPTSVDNNGITSVSFGGMTNTTHNAISGNAMYENFSNMVGSVPAGTTATVDITFATGYTYGTIIWVDWDNSMTFEANEVVYVGTSASTNPTTLTATFDVPATQALGNYRMRILAADMAFDSYTGSIAAAANADPCATFSWGVAEDYTLMVGDAPTCTAVTDLTVSGTTANTVTLAWTDALNTGATYSVYEVNATGETLVAGNISGTTYTVTGLTPSTGYTFGVVANCSATDASSMVTVSVTTDCVGGSCNIYIYAQDSFGDGWNGATINFVQAGSNVATYSMAGQGLSSTTIYDTATVSFCAGVPISFNWTSGAWDSEISFEIANALGEVVMTVQSGSSLTSGETFLTLDSCNATVDMILDTLTVILSVNDATMGTISPAPGTYYVSDTSSLTVVATPNTGYYFHGWTYNYNNNGTIYYDTVIDPTLTTIYIQGSYWMSVSPVNFTAIFSTQPYLGDSVLVNIAVNDPTMGTTVPAPGAHYFYEGDTCSVIAVPNTGYYLDGWYVMVTNNGDTVINQTAYTSTADVFDLFSFPIVVNSGYTPYVFNVTALFAAEPTCYVVTDLDVTATTANSITLSWIDSDNTGATYTVYDMSDSTVIATNITTTTYTVTGLTAATVYTFGVVANCSATDASNIATINASTECDVISIFPYTQNFNSIPACWNAMDVDGDGNSWEYISGAMHSASYDNYVGALTPDNWLITPHFQLAQNTSYEVTWNANPQDASWPAEHYGLYVSTTSNTDTSAFTLLQEWTLTSAGHVPVVDLSAYAGQTIYLAFRHWNCTDMFRIAIDNFELREQAGSNQITVTLTQNNPMYGSVSGSGVYTIGDNVTVTATAAQDYIFSRWADVTGATISTANPYTFVAATDITLQAIFISDDAETYDIVVEVNDSTMGYATGSGAYTAGDNAVLTAYAYEGYRFVNWTWNDMPLSTDNPFSMTVTSNSSLYPIVANFEVDTTTPDEYMTLITAVNDATMGTITPAPGTYHYYLGDVINFAATPNEGYHVESADITLIYMGIPMLDSTVDLGGMTTFNLEVEQIFLGATISVTVNFAVNGEPGVVVLNVNVNDANMGHVLINGQQATSYTGVVGETVTLEAVANEGFAFQAWSDGVTDATRTIVLEEAVTSFTANFVQNQGISQLSTLNSQLSIYPNPTTGIVNINADDVVKVEVMDLNGRLVVTFDNCNRVDLSGLTAGTYMLRIQTTSGSAVKRVVKK